jgi:2-polyprenyl-3-methyl-5-hydroxy-6-metoxy-1,4-benzoquinol methylase
MAKPSAVDAFNRDAVSNAGYLYTSNARLSSVLANERLTRAVLDSADFRGKSVLDVGCGDGTYTLDLFAAAQPSRIHAIDRAEQAIELGRRRAGDKPITFEACSAESLPFPDGSFDIALLRGVLHHLDRPTAALREAMRVARLLVVTEPNGYNPVLKALERFSAYHIEHEERSFFPVTLATWIRRLGGSVGSLRYVGLVPFFCPDPMARALKAVEPALERTPVLRSLCCGTYVLVVTPPAGRPA